MTGYITDRAYDRVRPKVEFVPEPELVRVYLLGQGYTFDLAHTQYSDYESFEIAEDPSHTYIHGGQQVPRTPGVETSVSWYFDFSEPVFGVVIADDEGRPWSYVDFGTWPMSAGRPRFYVDTVQYTGWSKWWRRVLANKDYYTVMREASAGRRETWKAFTILIPPNLVVTHWQ